MATKKLELTEEQFVKIMTDAREGAPKGPIVEPAGLVLNTSGARIQKLEEKVASLEKQVGAED